MGGLLERLAADLFLTAVICGHSFLALVRWIRFGDDEPDRPPPWWTARFRPSPPEPPTVRRRPVPSWAQPDKEQP